MSWPIWEGYTLRVDGLIREIAKVWDVRLVAALAPGAAVPFDGTGIDFRPVPRDASHFVLTSAEQASLREHTLTALREFRPDAVLVWSHAAEFDPGDGPPVVVDRIDCDTLLVFRDLKQERSLRAWACKARALVSSARQEFQMVRNCFATIVVGEADAAWLRAVSGTRNRVHVIPNGVTIPGMPASSSTHSSVPTVVFTGVMEYPPNVVAVERFAAEVWPLVRRRVPNARFVIAGRDPGPSIRTLHGRDGMEVTGTVQDMTAVLRDAWIAIAPMRSGAGIKNKVLEAWAVGTPAVLTPIAANGLGDDVVIRSLTREEPGDMAELIGSLLLDEGGRAQASEAVLKMALSRSWKVAAARVSELLLRAARVGHGLVLLCYEISTTCYEISTVIATTV